MRLAIIASLLLLFVLAGMSFTRETLRKQYSRPTSQWPRPTIDDGVEWKELGPMMRYVLPDSLKRMAELGSMLFFDTRLSGSGKISCGSCHLPERSWTDGRARSLGHEDQQNKRNAPTILNVWSYQRLFWDGRSTGLEDQAFAPINSESEMHGDIRELPAKLKRIDGYRKLFEDVFDEQGIAPDKIAAALATFQRTIMSDTSRFDRFLLGEKKALSNSEIRGLHLFRTKARCMNCHHGPMFTDNLFHHTLFSGNDIGMYMRTHEAGDSGRLRTPGLRDVAYTGPWMHDGSRNDLAGIITEYEKGLGRDPLMKPITLTRSQAKDLLAFLRAISAPPPAFNKPVLP